MEKIPEACALLGKSGMSYRRGYPDDENSSCDEWSESSASSSYSDSSSSIAEWENLVEESGELFYIDCHPQIQNKESVPEKNEEALTRTGKRRSGKGKLSRLLRRRESKRYSKRSILSFTDAYATSENANKVTFHDFQEGEVRHVTIRIDPSSRHRLGRRASLVESLFGLSISTFSDGNRVMIAGFVPDGQAIKHRNVKIGDWLKCVNDTDVNINTINAVLESMTEPQEVHLKLQRIAGIEVTKNPPMSTLLNQSEGVRQLTEPGTLDVDLYADLLCGFPVGVAFLRTEGSSAAEEGGPAPDDVLYCYPAPAARNPLCAGRGVFLTLQHLVAEVLGRPPTCSTLHVGARLAHVVYQPLGRGLLLTCFPDCRCSPREAQQLSDELVRVLQFCFQSVERCFGAHGARAHLDRFFLRLFSELLTGAPHTVDPDTLSGLALRPGDPCFETLLPAAHWIALPREAQMQLDDALNELEAGDYRDWNEDPLDCQRLFTVVGSSFYHAGHLLASHLPWDDHIDVHAFCRLHGLLHLSCTEPIRTLVLWREVFPPSCNRGLPAATHSDAYQLPQGRWFLLVVGNSKDLLTVLMESGGCTVPAEENQGPDPFYVEEAQATLEHIQNMGIPVLADKWMSINLRQQTISPDVSFSSRSQRRMDFFGNIGFMKSHSPPAKSPSPASKKPEVTSILKHRNSMHKSSMTLSGSSSMFSNEEASEDSASQGGHSEISDEPILGRRAAREKNALADSDDSDSDWDAYRPESQISGSFDAADLKQLSDVIPPKLTAGVENVLFHYVHFDATEGILVCPPDRPDKPAEALTKQVLLSFRRCAQDIRALFQNTIRFKNMLAQDLAKSVTNKSLIAIKEHGVLFECSGTEESGKKSSALTYWVIGRLFHDPHPRELYVCYRDTVPQNLVEIAFRLGMNMAG